MAQQIAKPSPVHFPLTGGDFKDLFASLVPIALNNTLAAFSFRRVEIMNLEVNRLREATNVLNSFLASMFKTSFEHHFDQHVNFFLFVVVVVFSCLFILKTRNKITKLCYLHFIKRNLNILSNLIE